MLWAGSTIFGHLNADLRRSFDAHIKLIRGIEQRDIDQDDRTIRVDGLSKRFRIPHERKYTFF